MIHEAEVVIQENVPLAKYTSWRIGGPAEFFSEPKNLEQLKGAVEFALRRQLPITILGGGSNVLISDLGIRGLTLVLHKFSGAKCEVKESRFVLECLGGTSKSELLRQFLKAQLAPALFLAGIPGDVGGGVAMNAGIGEQLHPREFVEIVDWIDVLRWPVSPSTSVGTTSSKDLPGAQNVTSVPSCTAVPSIDVPVKFEVVRFMKSDLEWTYRHCSGWQPGIIVKVGLSWPNLPDDTILAQVKKLNATRASRQPLDMPSCGSVFVNPANHKAGQLVESAGLKGFQIGGAQVSLKHANFIVNTGTSTAQDMHQVIQHVQQTVETKSGVRLQTEVVYLGDWT